VWRQRDRLRLAEGRFGLRWQVVPQNIGELRPPAAMRAMMTIKKLEIAALQNAAKQG
jgi:predicted 3-demethylubiquinone-9 3-methyltransferase (glyoxalase superfamily)